VTGVMSVETETGLINPGDQAEISFDLSKAVGIE